jgi:hypothetical protein
LQTIGLTVDDENLTRSLNARRTLGKQCIDRCCAWLYGLRSDVASEFT